MGWTGYHGVWTLPIGITPKRRVGVSQKHLGRSTDCSKEDDMSTQPHSAPLLFGISQSFSLPLLEGEARIHAGWTSFPGSHPICPCSQGIILNQQHAHNLIWTLFWVWVILLLYCGLKLIVLLYYDATTYKMPRSWDMKTILITQNEHNASQENPPQNTHFAFAFKTY